LAFFSRIFFKVFANIFPNVIKQKYKLAKILEGYYFDFAELFLKVFIIYK